MIIFSADQIIVHCCADDDLWYGVDITQWKDETIDEQVR
jgi:hypothetical protein